MKLSAAKNTVLMTTASVGQKIISFVYFSLIARFVGVEGTGSYFVALSFTTIFAVGVDLGLSNVLVREVAKVKDRAEKYLGTILASKIVFAICTYVLAIVVAHLMGYDEYVLIMIYLSGITMVFDSIHLSLYGVLRAYGNLRYEAIGIIASQAITLLLGSTFIFFNFPIYFLILAFTIPSFLNACYVGYILTKVYHVSILPSYDAALFRLLAKMAFPFALAGIFTRVYSYIDSILLLKIAGNVAAGWYSVPVKITSAFQFVPLAFVAALYPKFSEYHETNKEQFSRLFYAAVKYLLVLALPISVGIGVLSRDVILTVYTDAYANSILPLQILIASMVFSFMTFLIGAVLNATNRQGIHTGIMATVMVVNIIANIILIPRYGVVGASGAALFGGVLYFVMAYATLTKIFRVRHEHLFTTILQLGFSAAVMGIVVYVANLYVHFLVSIPIGALVYGILVFATRAIQKEDIAIVVKLIRSKKT